VSRRYLLVTGDFVKTGGMDRANFGMASYLARRGDEVHLVAFRADAELLAMPNVIFHRVAKPLGSYTLGLPLLARAGRRWAQDISARGGSVIVNGCSTEWDDVNWVHYVHAAFEPQSESTLRRIVGAYNYRKWVRDERRALHQARIIFANSHRTRRDIIDRIGVPPQRVHVVYYGIDPARFRPAEQHERVALRQRLGFAVDRKIGLFIGGLNDHRKGFDTLFAAWQRVRSAVAELYVIGAGSDVARWEQRARSTAAPIRFLGHRNDVPDLLRAADLLVSPTRYEAYGLAVHEALCCGVPAIVSADAGVAERYPPSLRRLLLNDPENAGELSDRLREWLEADSSDSRPQVRALADELRQWTWDDMAARMVDLIEGTDTADARQRQPEVATL
jgi:glycosyltransferase involved in cell wall biosynthesis